MPEKKIAANAYVTATLAVCSAIVTLSGTAGVFGSLATDLAKGTTISAVGAALLIAFVVYVLWRYPTSHGGSQRVVVIGGNILIGVIIGLYAVTVVVLQTWGDLGGSTWPIVLAAWLSVLLVVQASLLVQSARVVPGATLALRPALLRGAAVFLGAGILGISAATLALCIQQVLAGDRWTASSFAIQAAAAGWAGITLLVGRRQFVALASAAMGLVLIGVGFASIADQAPQGDTVQLGAALVALGVLAIVSALAVSGGHPFVNAIALFLAGLCAAAAAYFAWTIPDRRLLTAVFGMLALGLVLVAVLLVENGHDQALSRLSDDHPTWSVIRFRLFAYTAALIAAAALLVSSLSIHGHHRGVGLVFGGLAAAAMVSALVAFVGGAKADAGHDEDWVEPL
jgi:hypothetical protein